ncbi:hypothetical protein C8R44DRAFT_762616 [Mycena epipterygia]|nr:hypothetical protein C8R44DRAFT_762616 [Mycena epipterygia]
MACIRFCIHRMTTYAFHLYENIPGAAPVLHPQSSGSSETPNPRPPLSSRDVPDLARP